MLKDLLQQVKEKHNLLQAIKLDKVEVKIEEQKLKLIMENKTSHIIKHDIRYLNNGRVTQNYPIKSTRINSTNIKNMRVNLMRNILLIRS